MGGRLRRLRRTSNISLGPDRSQSTPPQLPPLHQGLSPCLDSQGLGFEHPTSNGRGERGSSDAEIFRERD